MDPRLSWMVALALGLPFWHPTCPSVRRFLALITDSARGTNNLGLTPHKIPKGIWAALEDFRAAEFTTLRGRPWP